MDEIFENDLLWCYYGFKISRCHSVSREIVQDMYLKIHKVLSDEPDKEINSSYIYQTLRSCYLDRFRDKLVYVDSYEGIDYQVNEESTVEGRKMIEKALDKIPYVEREILLLTQTMSLREVEAESKVNYQQVNKYKKRGFKKLKNLILCPKKKHKD